MAGIKNVVVIGGGAAGMMAAITAAQNGNFVTLVEKNTRLGRKLAITGKGRCNLTNNCNGQTLIANIPQNGKFLYSAFSVFNSQSTMSFFENAGVPLKTERGNRVFPVSDKALDIVDALAKTLKKHNVKVLKGTVININVNENSVTGVTLNSGSVISADAVILATGGKSYPLTGSTGDGYVLAQKLGHTVTKLLPSLVPLVAHQGFCTELAGLSLKNVTLSVFEEGTQKPVFFEQGEMLFTHFGISGPLVLSASAHMRKMGEKSYTAVIDLKPALTAEQLDNRILRDFSLALNKNFRNALGSLLPQKLIPVIVKLSGINGNTKINAVTKEQRTALCSFIKNLTVNITEFADISEAIVTRGGISVKEIEPQTMHSKLVKGLSFAGEIIDVDAYTGGFNLQIAFSTGYIAGGNV